MATKRSSTKVSAEKNKFQEMREDLDKKFSELTSLVNQRKIDLDRKINDLELEYNNKNKQIEKDKQTMEELREFTEQKLGQNTLMDVQNNIIIEISDKIQKLDSESKSQLELTLTLNWNFTSIKQEIDRIDLKLAPKESPVMPLYPNLSIPLAPPIYQIKNSTLNVAQKEFPVMPPLSRNLSIPPLPQLPQHPPLAPLIYPIAESTLKVASVLTPKFSFSPYSTLEKL